MCSWEGVYKTADLKHLAELKHRQIQGHHHTAYQSAQHHHQKRLYQLRHALHLLLKRFLLRISGFGQQDSECAGLFADICHLYQ